MKYIWLFVLMSNIVMAHNIMEVKYLIDTIAPPPENPVYIVGPETSCVGNTSVYTCDIPLSCSTNWYVNNELQTTVDGALEIIFVAVGDYSILLEFECDTITFIADSLLVTVTDIPSQPAPIQGDDIVCVGTTLFYTTGVGFGESCQWKVDGIIQVSDSTLMSYYWSEIGEHTIEVSAMNNCGISNASCLIVNVYELPNVDLGNDTTIYEGNTITLNAGNPGCTYLWSTGDTSQSIVVSQSGNYEVVVSNICGAVSDNISINFIVGVKEEPYSNVTICNRGDYIDFQVYGTKINKIQLFDLSGRLVGIYKGENRLYLPKNGIYFAKIYTAQNEMIIYRILM